MLQYERYTSETEISILADQTSYTQEYWKNRRPGNSLKYLRTSTKLWGNKSTFLDQFWRGKIWFYLLYNNYIHKNILFSINNITILLRTKLLDIIVSQSSTFHNHNF